jgi:hypothetical protein
MNLLLNVKLKAQKIKFKAHGSGDHKPYRSRLVMEDKKNSWITIYFTFKNRIIKCFETYKQKRISGSGFTITEWVVGKELLAIDCNKQHAYCTIIPNNVRKFSCKVSTSKQSVYLSCANEILRNRLLTALQPVVQIQNRVHDMHSSPLCAFCGEKGKKKYLPLIDTSYLPAPFAATTDKVCLDCFHENDETRRRNVTGNVVNVRRTHAILHSEQQTYYNAMPCKPLLPNVGTVDSFVTDIKRECKSKGVVLPAPQVDLVELGKKKEKVLYRPVNGRLEQKLEWRRQKESNFVTDEHVRLDLEKT